MPDLIADCGADVFEGFGGSGERAGELFDVRPVAMDGFESFVESMSGEGTGDYGQPQENGSAGDPAAAACVGHVGGVAFGIGGEVLDQCRMRPAS